MKSRNLLGLLGLIELIVVSIMLSVIIYCVCGILKNNKDIDLLNNKNTVQIRLLQYQTDTIKEMSDKLEKTSKLLENQKSDDDKLSARLDRLEEIDLNKPEPFNPSVIEGKIKEVIAKIEQLEKNNVTKEDFNKWVKNVEVIIEASLNEGTKPIPVNPEKTTVSPSIVQNVALSKEEKTVIINGAKSEIFKKLFEAGYGDYVNGKFVLRKAFFGAKIYPGEEEDFKPTINP